MLHLFSNKSGSGKTAGAVEKVISLHKKWGFDVYSNIHLAIPYTLIEDADDVMAAVLLADKEKGIIILVDELDQILGDTWSSNSADSRMGALAAKVVRKANVTLIGTIQLDTQANTRIRGNTDRFIEPLIYSWVNIKTLKKMHAPLTLEMKEMIEYTVEDGVRLWQPLTIVQEIKELDKQGQVMHISYKDFNAQKKFYKGLNVLECYDTNEIVLKDYGNADNDALMRAVALEKILTRILRKREELIDWNILKMDMSGHRMSYKTDSVEFSCLDIQMSSRDGALVWLDVVSTHDENGYVRLQTAKKKWDRIFDSIEIYGKHARGFLAYQHQKEWFFSELSRDNLGLYTKTGDLAKGNIYQSTIEGYSMDMECWLREIGGQGYKLPKGSLIPFPSPGGEV